MRVLTVLSVVALAAAAAAGAGPEPPSPKDTSALLVVYQEKGSSIDRRLSVLKSGSFAAASTKPVAATCNSRLREFQMNRLERLLSEANFRTLRLRYPAGEAKSNAEYRISYGGRIVRAVRGNEPLRLRRVGDYLRGLLNAQLTFCRKLGR